MVLEVRDKRRNKMSNCKGCSKIKKQVKELRERKRADLYVIVRSDCNDCGKDKQYGFWGLKEVKGWVHPNV